MIDWIDWISRGTTVLVIVTAIYGFYAWGKGILPAVIRLGNGLSKRKIAIFAKGDELRSLEELLLSSKLFNKKNITGISSVRDLESTEQATLFLVSWLDWQDHMTEVWHAKKGSTVLIVYAPPRSIPEDKMKELDGKRNVIVVNFRGRLLNDILVSLMTTGYQ